MLLRAIAQGVPEPSITKITLNNAYLYIFTSLIGIILFNAMFYQVLVLMMMYLS